MLALLMMMPPPVPAPPPDRVAAVTELLRTAPVPKPVAEEARDRATVAFTARYEIGSHPIGFEARRQIAARIVEHLATSERFAGDLNGCMTQEIGWHYDLPTLKSIQQVISTPGGRVLWNEVIPSTLARCYEQQVFGFLSYTGLGRAIDWYVGTRPKHALPPFGVAASGTQALSGALIAACGPSAKSALIERDGVLGVAEAWSRRNANSGDFSCLVQSAKLSGYDLPILNNDGSTTTVIMTS